MSVGNGWIPARVGQRLEEVDTPALVLELDAFERNLERMRAATTARSIRLRPHAKSHKCPEIALRQIALGAVGICCQKTSEAEPFAAAGVRDILITNEVVGAQKIRRLIALAGTTHVGVLVDDHSNLIDIGRAAEEAGVCIDIYIEVNVGANRCGVDSVEEVTRLAITASRSQGLQYAGLHCYHGGAQHLRSDAERGAAIAAAVGNVKACCEALRVAGIAPGVVTGAGTGSFIHERDSGVYGELQAGSYIFMDRDYARNTLGENDIRFEHSLFILASVLSIAGTGRAVLDAGLKAYSVDSGLPVLVDDIGATLVGASDEHSNLALSDSATLALGDKLRLIPGHCDPTVNLYDWIVCLRAGVVEAVWPIAARGALL